MKKLLFGIFVSLALVFSGFEMIETEDPTVDPGLTDGALKSLTVDLGYCGSESYTLWAGQTDSAGYVNVANDAENLYVEVFSTNGFQSVDENVKIWLGTDLLLLPRANSGAPINGQFPYKATVSGNSYLLTVALQDVEGYDATVCGEQVVYVVVHGDVISSDENGGTAETAFGGDIEGDGNRWWFYSAYVPVCCEDDPGGDPEYVLETAFAYGTHVFVSPLKGRRAGANNPDGLEYLELTRNRWGWAINLTETGTTTYDIWAAAGLNHTENGVLVGTATVEYDGTYVTVTLDTPGYPIEEVHVYANDLVPTTIAPGQYGYLEEYEDRVQTFTETFEVSDTDGDGIWLILHSVVAVPL